jgi:hypothetical protein
MPTRNPAVDAYIASSPDFARPILTHLREVVHAACPDVVEEMKWSTPHFDYKGMMCSMAAFKAHCAFGFWKGALVIDDGSEEARGQFGRITSLADLPPRTALAAYIRKAAALNDAGVPAPHVAPQRAKAKASRAKPVEVPAELAAALKKHKQALATWNAFAPSHQREYCEWITEAKRAETKANRVAQAVAWIAEGKQRNWKYMKSR